MKNEVHFITMWISPRYYYTTGSAGCQQEIVNLPIRKRKRRSLTVFLSPILRCGMSAFITDCRRFPPTWICWWAYSRRLTQFAHYRVCRLIIAYERRFCQDHFFFLRYTLYAAKPAAAMPTPATVDAVCSTSYRHSSSPSPSISSC